MLHVLFNLPTDLAADILSNWVGTAGTVRLDTAVCDSTTRPKLANILSGCIFDQPIQGRINTDNLVKWSLTRLTRVGTLYINEASDLSKYEAFLTTCGSAVSKIRLERRARSDVLSTTKLMSLAAIHCPQLKFLDWNGAGDGSDAALREVLTRCTLLQELRVSASFYSGFTSQSMEGILCPQLRTLALHCLYSVEVTAAFIKMAPNLDSLFMRTFRSPTEDGIIALQHINPSLKHLEITDSQIKDDELIYIVNLCPHIVSINVSDAGFQGTVLTVRGIEYMAQHLTSLAKVNLSCSNLTEDCLLALVRHRSSTLTVLDIVQCYDLSVPAINAVLRQCPKLTRLGTHLDRDVHVLDFTLLANIKDLHLVMDTSGKCAAVLTQIAEHCPKLQHLLLDVLEELETTDELDTIVENCVDIRTLKIRAEEFDCGGFVSQEKLEEWKVLRPQLVVTDGHIYEQREVVFVENSVSPFPDRFMCVQAPISLVFALIFISMLQHLISLPTDVVSDVLSNWVGMAGTARLDSAVCESSYREKFVAILSNCKFDPTLKPRANSDNIVKWSVKRKSHVDMWLIDGESDLAMYAEFFNKGIRCPLLRNLTLEDLTDATILAAIIQMAPNLHCLRIACCCTTRGCNESSVGYDESALGYSDSALDFIGPTITTLEVTDSSISDEELINIADRCPNITTISVSDSDTNLSVKGIEYIAQHLAGLTKVDLSSPDLTEESLLALVRHRAQTLTALDIVQCFALKIETVESVLRQCSKLTRFGFNLNELALSLDFTLLTNMTDLHFVIDSDGSDELCITFLSRIAEHCPKLEHLFLDIIDEFDLIDNLDCIFEKCVHIRTLKYKAETYFCRGFLSKEKIDQWTRLRPQLQVLKAYGE